MGVIQGKNFKFYIKRNGVPIAICKATDCTININTEELETTGPSSGAYKYFIPGLHDIDIQVPGIVAYSDSMNYVQIQELQLARTTFEWEASAFDNGGLRYKGNAFIRSSSQTSNYRDLVRFDATLRVTGALVIEKGDIISRVYLADLLGVRLPGCPNPYPVAVLWYDGTVIGLANNPDDVITQFNNYPPNIWYRLSQPDNSCNFTMNTAWNAPEIRTFVPAEQGGSLALWTGRPADEGISTAELGNNLISPFEYTS